jgi:hypothetical protein
LQTETRLASYGRSQEQIQKIIKTATDMAAAGIMDYDSAVNSLNATLSGVVRVTPALNKELKDLGLNALTSGKAIDIIAGKVAGNAEAAMKTGAFAESVTVAVIPLPANSSETRASAFAFAAAAVSASAAAALYIDNSSFAAIAAKSASSAEA